MFGAEFFFFKWAGKRTHKLVPVRRLEKKIRQLAGADFEDLLAKETELSAIESQTLRNMELHEKNIETIIEEVDLIIEEKASKQHSLSLCMC